MEVANSELMNYVSQWSDLCRSGASETSRALKDCKWDDTVGEKIKTKIEETVYAHLQDALELCADEISNIDLDDFEEKLSETERHLANHSIS